MTKNRSDNGFQCRVGGAASPGSSGHRGGTPLDRTPFHRRVPHTHPLSPRRGQCTHDRPLTCTSLRCGDTGVRRKATWTGEKVPLGEDMLRTGSRTPGADTHTSMTHPRPWAVSARPPADTILKVHSEAPSEAPDESTPGMTRQEEVFRMS